MKAEEPDYVVVARSLDDELERIELPTEQDHTLGLQTLAGAFPGAHGLKYKNPATGAYRALLIDKTGTKFHPPPDADGWSNKVFIVLLPATAIQEATANSKSQVKKSDQNAKRRKLMIESDDGDSCDSDAEQDIGGKYNSSDNPIKRQQGTTSKQKRMMGANSSNKGIEMEAAEDEKSTKIVDLLVLSLPFELTEDELKIHFEQFGKVVHCEVKTQKSSKLNRGFGFVQMADMESQQKVLNQKVHFIGGRECPVKIPFTKNALSSKVFVGQIKEGTTTMELRNLFTEEAHKIDSEATVTDVYIPRPFRSFGFVTFSSPMVAKELIKKAQFLLGDTPIYVSSAHSTRPHQSETLSNQLQHYPSNRTSSFQHLPGGHRNEQFYQEWYSNVDNGNGHKTNFDSCNQQNAAVNPSRMVGPMFTGQSYPQQSNLPLMPIYGGNPPPPTAAAGNQMLNQLETLNLNNIGIGHEVVNAIKAAIFSVAQNTSVSSGAQQQQMSQRTVRNQAYQSLSPPPQTSSGSSPNRACVPSHGQLTSHQHHQQQGRQNMRGTNNNGSGSQWR